LSEDGQKEHLNNHEGGTKWKWVLDGGIDRWIKDKRCVSRGTGSEVKWYCPADIRRI